MNDEHIDEYIDRLWRRGCEYLGVKYALMSGAMTWVSEHNLVSAVSKAGGFGILAAGSFNVKQLAQEIERTIEASQGNNFGVNLIVLHPLLDDLLDLCISSKVSHIVFAGGVPRRRHIEKCLSNSCHVMGFASNLSISQRLIKWGVDGLIIEGMEAGGHIGSVSSMVLGQEILPFIDDCPIFVAGGIGRGEGILSWLEMGASGCQLGTRFVACYESIAHKDFKRAYIRARARDAKLSRQLDERFKVIPVRALENSASEEFLRVQKDVISRFDKGLIDYGQGQLEIEHFWAGALRRAVIDGDIEHGSMMAGQSVGMIKKEESVAEVFDILLKEMRLALRKKENYVKDIAKRDNIV